MFFLYPHVYPLLISPVNQTASPSRRALPPLLLLARDAASSLGTLPPPDAPSSLATPRCQPFPSPSHFRHLHSSTPRVARAQAGRSPCRHPPECCRPSSRRPLCLVFLGADVGLRFGEEDKKATEKRGKERCLSRRGIEPRRSEWWRGREVGGALLCRVEVDDPETLNR